MKHTETPETDKKEFHFDGEGGVVCVDFARGLEEERDAARALAEKYRDRVAQIKARSSAEYEAAIKQHPLPWESGDAGR